MTGIYCTVVASLACGASAFFAPSTMFGTGLMALRRTSSGTRLMSSRRLLSRGGATVNPPSMTGEHYDYLVIGGGSGGVASARRAATYDAKASRNPDRCMFPRLPAPSSCLPALITDSRCVWIYRHRLQSSKLALWVELAWMLGASPRRWVGE